MTNMISVIGEGSKFSKQTEQAKDERQEETGNPADSLYQKISEVQLNNDVSFARAKVLVFNANPQLAREYIHMYDGGA